MNINIFKCLMYIIVFVAASVESVVVKAATLDSDNCSQYLTVVTSSTSYEPAIIPDQLLIDSSAAIQCLAQVLKKINGAVGPQGLPRDTTAQLLTATAALRTVLSRELVGNERPSGDVSLTRFISEFRELSDLDATSALAYGVRSPSDDLRLNSFLILTSIIDNKTLCVVLAHLNDPALGQSDQGPRGRANLLSAVSVVAPWAYKENFENINRTIGRIQNEPDVTPSTQKLLDNIRARLSSQNDNSNKNFPMKPEWRSRCRTYIENFRPPLINSSLRYPPDSN